MNKKSIKWKITIGFIAIIMICILSILLFNTFFLEKVYTNEKVDVLKQTYEVLNKGLMQSYENGNDLKDLFSQNEENGQRNIGPGYPSSNILDASNETNFSLFLRSIQETYNLNIALMDKDNNIYSLYLDNQRFDKRLISYLFVNNFSNSNLNILYENENMKICLYNRGARRVLRPATGNKENLDNDGNRANVIIPNTNYFNNSSYIEAFGFLEDKETAYLMTIPYNSIKESVSVFNRYLILISIFVIIFGAIAIYILSSRFSKPVIEMSQVAKKMSNLEFDEKITNITNDEIGDLGETINDLSDKLETNIKELKNANIQLKKDIEQKEQLDIMRQEFVANVSHELKTPIALIQGYAEGLQVGLVNNKNDIEFYSGVIIDEANKMNHLVRQLLDLSAIERGGEDIEISRINLKEAVETVVNSLKMKFDEKRIVPKIEIIDGTYIWADDFKVEEVIRNYITNAINHCDENKLIIIGSESIKDKNDYERFFVYNSGKGLEKDDLIKVWDKFYKVDKARTREYGGSGLGLSIVKAIAKEHNTICGCENVKENFKYKNGIKFYFDFSIK